MKKLDSLDTFFSSFFGLLASTRGQEIDTADTDTADTCVLLDASCDHDGFTITFITSCATDKYKAIQVDELFASGPTAVNTYATFNEAAAITHNAECVFGSTANADGNYEMKFNFKQCGTTHEAATTDTTELEYYNAVQGLEYYSEVVLGVKVFFDITCTAQRDATISEQPAAVITGDQTFDAADMENRPAAWAQSVLSMNFYTDATFATEIDGTNQVPLGEDVHVQIVTNVANEEINTRIERCWVTPDNDMNNAVFFDLYKAECTWTDLDWVTLDPTANGASPNTFISFQSLRFPGAYSDPTAASFWLHCDTYMCYSDSTDGEDCKWIYANECPAAGRRRRDDGIADGGGNYTTQDNGIVASDTLSAEVIVTAPLTDDGVDIDRVKQVATNLDDAMERMKVNFKKARNRIRNLRKLLDADDV